MNRYLLKQTLVAAVITLVLPASLMANWEENSEPYISIDNCEALDGIRNDLHGKYQLTADINCEGVDFRPIGDSSLYNAFRGELNGGYHTIYNLTIVGQQGDKYLGLFGTTWEAVIKNLTLDGAKIIGNADTQEVGALIGHAHGTQLLNNEINNSSVKTYANNEYVLNVGGMVGSLRSDSIIDNAKVSNTLIEGAERYSTGGIVGGLYGASLHNALGINNQINGQESAGGIVGFAGNVFGGAGDIVNVHVEDTKITGQAANVGGLIGGLNSMMVRQSSVTNTLVEGNSDAGGLVGWAFNSLLVQTWVTDSVSVNGSDRVGGLVGYQRFDTGIQDSYSAAKVTGKNSVGGLVGESCRFGGTVYKTYATGKVVSLTGRDAGGLVGKYHGDEPDFITASFWDWQTTGQRRSAGGEAKSTAQMMQQSTFTDIREPWDFANIWDIDEGESYPYLQN